MKPLPLPAIGDTDRRRFLAKVGLPDENGCCPWLASTDRWGYGKFRVGGMSAASAHRVSYSIFIGPIPDGMELDHLCHVRRCVAPGHLRPVTNKQNQENRAGASRNNDSSGVRGVYRTASNRWKVQVCHHGQTHYFGTFATVEEAERAAVDARRALFATAEGCAA